MEEKMKKSTAAKNVFILAIISCALLVFCCVGVIFASFYDYRAGSSGPHQINKLGYVEITTNVNNDVVLYPGCSYDYNFNITNSVNGGQNGTLPIVITDVSVVNISYQNAKGDVVVLNNDVVTYSITSYTTTAIASNGTGVVQGSLQVKPSATYNTMVDIDSSSYLTNKSTKVFVTLLFKVSEAV